MSAGLNRVLVLGVVLASGSVASAASFQPSGRQCYGPWIKSVNPGCYYRIYYYKPKPTSQTYKTQRAYCYDSRPGWIYFYNPDSEKFWCCCPTIQNSDATCRQKAQQEKEWWGVLPKSKRSKDLDECVDEFPDPSDDECPEIPDSMDGMLMEMPPPSLPN